MSDPLSVAASIVSLTVPALHGARILLDDLSSLIDAPQTVQSLKNDLSTIEMALQSLQGIRDPEWEALGQVVAEQCQAAIRNCEETCSSFLSSLQHWTRHSQDGKLSWVDRANVGFFKERRIKAMSVQLQSCKLTFNSAVGVANLYSSMRHTNITQEMRHTISVREIEVSRAITSTDASLAEVQRELTAIQLHQPNEQPTQSDEDTRATAQQLEQERATLNCSLRLLQALLPKAQETAVIEAASKHQEKSTNITFGQGNSGFQAGILNGNLSNISWGKS